MLKFGIIFAHINYTKIKFGGDGHVSKEKNSLNRR
jgi:hypothetical protein